MVVSTLIGGLGNQMFQYAAGRALAVRTGSKLVLDLGWLERPPADVTPRSYELDCFQIEAEVARIYPRTAVEHVREVLRLSPRVWREQMYQFAPQTLELSGSFRLVGYWVSERYFEEYADQIRKDFSFRDPPRGANQELAARIRDTTAVSVHVRRGDYVENPTTRAFHGVLPVDYYVAAAARLRRTVRDPHFYVFSDDPEWCRSTLDLGGPTTVVDHNRGHGSGDLRLTSLCRHHVIANSSFSWWGAWLNPSPDKVVIAPRRWIAVESFDTSHVLPPEWITVYVDRHRMVPTGGPSDED